MKKILGYIILCVSFSFLLSTEDNVEAKTYVFTEEEVKSLYNSINDLEYADSLNKSIIIELEKTVSLYKNKSVNDSLWIDLQIQKIDLLENRVDLYKDLSVEIQPKWYENKWLWFFGGILVTTQSIKLAGELSN
tara:strand:- start:246 stop:647 length:402 start_codon:yes stop_codon:yes gene_type:complete